MKRRLAGPDGPPLRSPSPGRLAPLALLGLAALGIAAAREEIPDARPEARAEAPRGGPAGARQGHRIALIATEPQGASSELYLVDPDATELPPPVGRLDHARGAAVRGAAIGAADDATFLVVADASEGGDRSFASALWRVRRGAATRLCDDVVYASRPIVASPREVLVSRGAPGSVAGDAGRVDALRVDVVDPESGAARELARADGFTLYVAGVSGREAILYRLAQGRAELVAVDLDDGRERALREVAPFARDFALDPERRELALVDRADGAWEAEAVDLDSGDATPLARSASWLILPQRAHGERTIADAGGTRWLDRSPSGEPGAIALPAPGALHVAAQTDALLAGTVQPPGGLPVPVAWRADAPAPRALPAPAGRFVSIAGVLEGGAR